MVTRSGHHFIYLTKVTCCNGKRVSDVFELLRIIVL